MARAPTTKIDKDEPLEKQLWKAADKLRKNIDAAEYKHVVLGLIFLKYISDSFEEQFAKLQTGAGEFAGADPEDKDEYKAENIFFVPPDARWSYLLGKATQPDIGSYVDGAMDAIEKENPSLKGVLPKVFARQNLDPASLGGLINLVGNIALGDAKARSADVLGHVFEYFLGEFALAEGKQGGQFYTPRSIVELLVVMLEPYKGRVLGGTKGLPAQKRSLGGAQKTPERRIENSCQAQSGAEPVTDGNVGSRHQEIPQQDSDRR
jgi:type I restriction enzyme M protein